MFALVCDVRMNKTYTVALRVCLAAQLMRVWGLISLIRLEISVHSLETHYRLRSLSGLARQWIRSSVVDMFIMIGIHRIWESISLGGLRIDLKDLRRMLFRALCLQ